MNPSEVDKFYTFEINGTAYLEDRRFKRSVSENYLFLRRDYLVSIAPRFESEIIEQKSVEVPLSLSEELRPNFLSFSELVAIVPFKISQRILKDLWIETKGFDPINIVFEHISRFRYFNSDTINFILKHAFSDSEIRSSFRVQDYMLDFLINNLHLIDTGLLNDYLINFPKTKNLALIVIDKYKKEYDGKIEKIKKEIDSF